MAQDSSTGTKTNTRLIEVPQSISVVTRQQMEAQGARSIAEALRYEVGVVSETRVGDRFDNVFIRGFGGFGGNANYLHFWDGLRLPRGVSYAMPSIDPYLLDRIEILRGPASVLYGQNNPGGAVNLISKSPTAIPFREVWTGFGSHNRIEGGFDVGGPANEDGSLLYRVIGLGRKADSEVNFTETERWLIAPSFTWRPNDQTTLTVRASYDHDPHSYQPNWLPAQGTLLPNGAFPRIPKSFFAGSPDFNEYDRKQATAGYEFEHRFNDIWTVRQNFRYVNIDSVFKAMAVNSIVGTTLRRQSTYYVENLNAATVDNQAEAKFVTGAFHHKVLAGLDYQWSSASARFGNSAPNTYSVDYLNPVYTSVTPPALATTTEQRRTQTGVYLQDQIRFEKWAFLLGLRNDWADGTSRTYGAATNFANPVDSKLTWRAGATYLFDNGLAPYVSYSTSFDPTLGTDYTGKAFVPTTGEQYEVGLKYQPAGFNGMFMLSFFDLTQQNALTADSAHSAAANPLCTPAGPSCQIQAGEIRSRGVEASVKMTPVAGLNIIASYTDTNIHVTKDTNAALLGKTPVGVPDKTANLWTDYTFQNGDWRGWGFGGGVRYVGVSNGINTNLAQYKVPSFTLFDVGIFYDLARVDPLAKGWSLAVNATNLADKKYVSACASATQCFYGTGRTVLGKLAYRW